MPIYEYQCAACGRRHEALQKFKESPLRDCPHCSKPELVKLVSAVGFRLAGGGWYETDFKTGDKRNLVSASDEKGAGDKGGEKGGGKDGGKDKTESGKRDGGEKAPAGAAAGGAKPASSPVSPGKSSPGKSSSGKSSSGKPSASKPSPGGGA